MFARASFRMLVLLFVAVAALTACKETRVPPGALFPDTPDIHVEDARIVDSQDTNPGLAEGGATYVIARIKYTNHTGGDFAPIIDHFVLSTPDGNRYFGMDTGSTTLVGISNPRNIVKNGESQEYTVGFRTRAGSGVGGSIYYEIEH